MSTSSSESESESDELELEVSASTSSGTVLAAGGASSSSEEESESEDESESDEAAVAAGWGATSAALRNQLKLLDLAKMTYALELPAIHAASSTPAAAIFALVSPSNALTERVNPLATR